MKSADQENLPQAHQWRDTDSYPETEAVGMNQIRERIIINSRFNKKFQAQRNNKPSRGYTIENQSQQNFTRPPPNMEKNKYHHRTQESRLLSKIKEPR